MRKVLRDMAEVCHFWAHERQSEGNAGNVSFSRAWLYSYGTPIARIVRRPEGVMGPVQFGGVAHDDPTKAYLVTSRSYSVSTSKHVSRARSAIPRGALVFYVDEVDRGGWNEHGFTPARQVEVYADKIAETEARAKRARSNRDYLLARAQELREEANAFAQFFGLALVFSPELVERLRAERHEATRRHREEQDRQSAERARVARIRMAERVPQWLAGNFGQSAIYDYPDTLLRLVQNGTRAPEVETSRGVTVWASDARTAFAIYMTAPDVLIGRTLDVYEIRSATAKGIQIGCHWLTRAEIIRFGISCGWVSVEALLPDDRLTHERYSARVTNAEAMMLAGE